MYGSGYNQPTPMEIGAAEVQDQRANPNGMNQVICYNCQQPGHIARNCRMPRRNDNRPNGQQRYPPGNGRAGRR